MAGRSAVVPALLDGRLTAWPGAAETTSQSTSMSERLNIAHCIHGLGLGGAQQIVKTLVRQLQPERHRCFVYCCLDGPVRAELERAGATVRILKRRLPRFDPGWVLKLAKAMRRDKIDLAHTHLFGDSLHGYLAACAAGQLPVVMTLHSRTELLNPLQRLGYRWLIARKTRAVACSEGVRRSFVAATGKDEILLPTIRNGIEDPLGGSQRPPDRHRLRRELDLDPEAVIFAAVGRLSPEKDISSLIRAYAPLARSRPRASQLVILGDGPLRQELEAIVRSESLTAAVRFLGFRPEVPTILPALDVVVFNSLSEGLPIALLEAMATSRCIVGTGVPGILEAVRPDSEGLIVPPGEVDRLHEALVRAFESEALRNRLGRAARLRFSRAFQANRMVRAYESLYQETAGNSMRH